MNKSKLTKSLFAVILCLSVLLLTGLAALADAAIENGDFEVVTDGSGLEISTAVYTDGDGAFLNALPAGETVKAKVSIKNPTAEAKKISVVSAVYDSYNTTKSMTVKNISVSANRKTTVENSIALPAEANSGWSIKTYLFENLGNMYSYCESFSYPAKPPVETKWEMGKGFLVSSEEAYAGYSAMKVTGEASECIQPITLNPNSMYKMNFIGKGNAGLSYGVYDTSGAELSGTKQFTPSDSWNLNSVLFKTADEEEAVVKFVSDGTGSAFIDNVSLSDDVIFNGGFEDDELGWTFEDSCFEVSTTNAYEGKKSLKITSDSSGQKAYQETDVIPHSKGMLTFKSKCSEDVQLKILDGDSNELISKAGLSVAVSSDWKDNSIFLNTLGYDKLKICFETKSSNSRISYIDDVKFIGLQYPDELINADFENGTEGWTSAYATLSTTEDTENVFSGTASAWLTGRTKTYSSITQKTNAILNKYGPGSYYFEAYVKPAADITGGWIVVRVKHTPKGGSETTKSLTLSNPQAVWTKISGVVDIEFDSEVSSGLIGFETSMRTGFDDEAVYGDLFIDDVSFFKMPD